MAKKRTVIITSIFFSVMILLTFCSRTVYRSMLPKVNVTNPFGGTLSYDMGTNNFELYTENVLYEYIPFRLNGSLSVLETYAEEGKRIAAGDALVRFYPPDGEALLKAARETTESARISVRVVEERMADAWDLLDARMQAATDAKTFADLQDEQDMLKDGLVDGTSIDRYYEALRVAEEQEAFLQELSDSDWILHAQHSGVVCETVLTAGGSYSGMSRICTVAHPDYPVYVRGTVAGLPDMSEGKWSCNVTAYARGGIMRAINEYEIDKNIISFCLDDYNLDAADLLSIAMDIESPYQRCLVANDMIQGGNQLYVLVTTTGAWGKTEYKVALAEVETGASDRKNTVIKSELDRGVKIITGWTEPIYDGMTVLPAGYE